MNTWTVRLIAACALTLAGAACGRSLAAARRLRAGVLDELCGALSRLEIAMTESLLPLNEALRAANHPTFTALADQIGGDRTPRRAWDALAPAMQARGQALSSLTKDDLSVLSRLFDAIGATPLAGQRLLLNQTCEQMRAQRADARKAADEQSRLYASIGLLCGMALAVLLI